MSSYFTAGLWGSNFLLNVMGLFGFNKRMAAFWIEHVVSNLQWPISIYIMYELSSATVGWGWITLYGVYALASWGLYNYLYAMPSIKTLRPDYPYLDSSLVASFLYLLGISEHLTEYPFMSVEWEPTQDSINEEVATV